MIIVFASLFQEQVITWECVPPRLSSQIGASWSCPVMNWEEAHQWVAPTTGEEVAPVASALPTQ